MSHGLPDDWYEEHDGQRLVLNSDKVATEIERLRDAIKYAVEELDKFSDFMGAEGHFTYAKEIKGMVLPKLAGVLTAGQ